MVLQQWISGNHGSKESYWNAHYTPCWGQVQCWHYSPCPVLPLSPNSGIFYKLASFSLTARAQSKSATFTPPCKPFGTWVKKAMDVLTHVEKQTHATCVTLILPEDFDCQNASHVAQVWVLLQAAAEQVDSTGQSPKLIWCEEKEVISRKEAIIALLKQIDIWINFLGPLYLHHLLIWNLCFLMLVHL
jgi:hypothetical protein